MKVSGANVLTSNYAITPTPLTACGFFAHAMARAVDVKDIGIAVMHHNYRLNEGETDGLRIGLQQKRAATYIDKHDYASGVSLSMQPVATADIEITLIIEVEGRPDHDEVEQFLKNGRLAGGNILSYRSMDIVRDTNPIEDLIPASGFWLIDRSELIDTGNPAASLIELLSRRHQASADEYWSQEQLSFLSPVVMAYALTSDPTDSLPGIRTTDDLVTPEHAFCEPMLGLGQYVSVRRFSGSLPFWRGRWVNPSLYAFEQTLNSTEE